MSYPDGANRICCPQRTQGLFSLLPFDTFFHLRSKIFRVTHCNVMCHLVLLFIDSPTKIDVILAVRRWFTVRFYKGVKRNYLCPDLKGVGKHPFCPARGAHLPLASCGQQIVFIPTNTKKKWTPTKKVNVQSL